MKELLDSIVEWAMRVLDEEHGIDNCTSSLRVLVVSLDLLPQQVRGVVDCHTGVPVGVRSEHRIRWLGTGKGLVMLDITSASTNDVDWGSLVGKD